MVDQSSGKETQQQQHSTGKSSANEMTYPVTMDTPPAVGGGGTGGGGATGEFIFPDISTLSEYIFNI